MADQAGIDLAPLAGRGSGPEGRIVKADVERLIGGDGARPPAPAQPRSRARRRRRRSAPTTAELRDLTPMLKAVAARMAQSKQTVPHFYVEAEIDMTRALELRAELNDGLAAGREGQRQRPDRAGLRDGADRAPQAHRSYVDGRHAYHAHANVGIAVALDDGLIVPVHARRRHARACAQIRRRDPGPGRRARDGQLRQREI